MQTASQIVNSMMQSADAGVVRRLQEHKAVIAIIGKTQATGDIPDFWQHRYSGGAPTTPAVYRLEAAGCCSVLMLHSCHFRFSFPFSSTRGHMLISEELEVSGPLVLVQPI